MLRDRGRRRLLDRRHPWLLDTAVVLFMVLVALPDLLTVDHGSPFGDDAARDALRPVVLYAFVAALVVPLWWRRRAPVAVYFTILAVNLAEWSAGIWLRAGTATLVALYTPARHGSLRVLGWAVGLTLGSLALAVYGLAPVDHPLLGAFFLLGTLTAPVAVGHGWNNTETAERLVLTESTVKKHVGRVLAKIGARDRIQAVITAYDAGLVRAR
ncbi:LuxR C-terminal-related transcriptional regulator [Streptomyces sp. NPDC094038]|uniref:helix-turn-helix transcriptional regulator n=1 Tax=Streptomyces sp. NPDC094038 TaxID=3366055 RepID=UPI0038100491